MKVKNLTIWFLVMTLLLTLVSASMIIPANDNAKENAKAPEKSPVIGDNWELERVDFIHYAKPPNEGKPPKTEGCYKLLGVKWNSLPVTYVINPTNPEGLDEGFVTGAVSASAETWDGATSSELFNNVYMIDSSAQYGVLDSKNTVAFGDYPNDNVIAVTSIWYNRRTKKIVEFDILFNTRFNWGDATSNPVVMDLENIATHELGHGVGLNDVYSTMCSAVTMYGYSTEGETQKRTLEQADIVGLQKMYGS
ncbi:MAG: matrixin family metalloprotease [Candidatus Micrarchaeia archaeon]